MSGSSGAALIWQDVTLSARSRAVIASQQAQKTYYSGLKAWAERDYATARDLLEYANRQAPESQHVMFALVLARQMTGDLSEAEILLSALLSECDFKEGWMLLSGLRLELQDVAGALAAAEHLLSHFSCNADIADFVSKIYHLNGAAGWCGLEGNGQIRWGSRSPLKPVSVCYDDTVQPVCRRGKEWFCPEGWQHAEVVSVIFSGGDHFFGNDFRPEHIIKCEGFVEEEAEGLRGWAWFPYDSQREPVLKVIDVQSGKTLQHVHATVLDETGGAQRPGAMYRHFSLSQHELPAGFISVRDEYGRDLAGSPLFPGQKARSAVAVARYLAGMRLTASEVFSSSDKGVAESFLPVPVLTNNIPAPEVSGRRAPLAIIIPVFRDLTCTRRCLEAVRKTTQGIKIQVLVINDASPERELTDFVNAFCEKYNFSCHQNERNLGFPGTVNKGLRALAGHDVILLNSDTCVAEGWLAELRRIAYRDQQTGTVTPFSNDASILSYPSHERENAEPDAMQTRVFMAAALVANKGVSYDIPTGHGFCLYIRHDCLKQTGLLREDVFAQGYGEENDFCMRARALGWKHKAAPGVFVAHTGAASFGSARADLMARNADTLEDLHPGYHALVADWIRRDPLSEARRRFDQVRFRARGVAARVCKKTVLLVTHHHGGGVERVIQERAASYRKRSFRVLILRPSKKGCLIEDSTAPEDFPSLAFTLPDEHAGLLDLLQHENVQKVELHHLLGHHPSIVHLANELCCSCDVFVHDYMWFCQRISLLDPSGNYCGEPDLSGCERCISTGGNNIEEDISVAVYVQRSASVLSMADTVYVPSRDTAQRMLKHFPEITCVVRPAEKRVKRAELPGRGKQATAGHYVPADGFLKTPRQAESRRLRLCIVGAIGREKGYDVLYQAALDAALRDLPLEFVLVGHTPDDTPLLNTGRVYITGRYKEGDAVTLLESIQADAAFLPSVWPETWCFTLELAWKAGLSVIAFDHGAPAERIRATGQGVVINPHLRGAELNEMLIKSINIGNK